MAALFNPRPRIHTLPIAGRHACHVIDDALVDPDALVDWAAARRGDFADAGVNAFPGVELRMPEAFSAQLDAYFAAHVRGLLGLRRTARMYSRLSITTTPPQALTPTQSLCHIDRLDADPRHGIAACVLYLFGDERLGGTAFYRPTRRAEALAPLLADAQALDRAAFQARHGLPGGYMTASNPWFEKLAVAPARYNRLIVYPGNVFHSAEILHPALLSPDPRHGRLCLNGFFTCTRALAG